MKKSKLTRVTLNFCLSLVVFFISTINGRCALEINVTQGTIAQIPIAITDFAIDNVNDDNLKNFTDVIRSDLKNCGLFSLINPQAFIQTQDTLQDKPHFSEWRLINADNLVTGKIKQASDGHLRIEFRLFDVVQEIQIEGQALSGLGRDWRRIAHKVADAIYERLTGEKGYFDTKIIYVARQKMGIKRSERLAIMDQDGANNKYITAGDTLVLTPRFSPNLASIAFMDFKTRTPRVYLMNLLNNQKTLMGNFPGMTFAPRFSNDGTRLVMSFARSGMTSIYELNLVSHTINQLTFDPIIDTSPCYSPDDQQIAFNSDRSGRTQIYIMPAKGGEAKRITFGQGSYRTPVWSPRGDYIAFTKMFQGRFYIGVIRPDGTGERLLTQGYMIESPSWSPNGRVILYTREDRGHHAQLWSIDLTGINDRHIPTETGAMHGCWSPFMPQPKSASTQ